VHVDFNSFRTRLWLLVWYACQLAFVRDEASVVSRNHHLRIRREIVLVWSYQDLGENVHDDALVIFYEKHDEKQGVVVAAEVRDEWRVGGADGNGNENDDEEQAALKKVVVAVASDEGS
jgi:hypothetical protein